MSIYSEIPGFFIDHLRDDVVDAIETACITQAEWEKDPDDCLSRVSGALEEMFLTDDYPDEDYGPSWEQEWYDFDPEC